ncbi:MAG TPA: alpha/beta hydrolase [Microthrixaceae bacterium]|nr:alpha/beta hydrolase [Microthrixaceae bacterium]
MSTPVPGGNPDDPEFVYDEFSYFRENCAEYEIDASTPVVVDRVSHHFADGRVGSALKWGSGTPRIVLLHGGAQNAHTWDTVALALSPVPILAIDLSGHGHSSWREDAAYNPRSNAEDAAAVMDEFAPEPSLLVGMSLGGLTANAVATIFPWLVERLVVIDVTPGVTRDKAAEVHAFIEGPQSFGSFQEIFDRTVEFNPTRSLESLRRGILHNAHRVDGGDGWEWNYDRRQLAGVMESLEEPHFDDLWQDVEDVRAPYLLLQGGISPVVDDDDIAELRRRNANARVQVVEGAGHSIQGDRPIELAEILKAELAATESASSH